MNGRDYKIPVLYDFYGDFLTDKQKDAIEFYYEEDMSLSEMTEHIFVRQSDGSMKNITRQGARDCVKSAEKALCDLEERLGLVARFEELKSQAHIIKLCAANIRDINFKTAINKDITENVEKIVSAANNIIK